MLILITEAEIYDYKKATNASQHKNSLKLRRQCRSHKNHERRFPEFKNGCLGPFVRKQNFQSHDLGLKRYWFLDDTRKTKKVLRK